MASDLFSAEILGNRAVLDNLAALEPEIRALVQAKLEEAGQMALEHAIELTPVDTGYLQSRNQMYIEVESVSISNDANYGLFVEMGHHTRSGSFVEPQHFLIPAWEEAGQWLMEQLQEMFA